MSIINMDEVKTLLRLTDNTYDEEIEMLIPLVQDDVCEYLNNYFADPIIYRDGNTALEFVRGDTDDTSTSADYITDTDARLSSVGFSTAHEYDVLVEGGGANAGIHHVTALTTAGGKFTLDSTGVLIDLDMDDMQNFPGGCRISLIYWPKAIKPYVAQMIWHRIDKPKPSGAKAETIDDYSITYAGAHTYPTETLQGLSKWKNAILI